MADGSILCPTESDSERFRAAGARANLLADSSGRALRFC